MPDSVLKPFKVPAYILAYKSPHRSEASVVDHSKIERPGGDLVLTGNLSLYVMRCDCPTEPGLWLLKATVYIPQGRGTVTVYVHEATTLHDRPAALNLPPLDVRP
ncbi:hypothetical protein C5Y96_05810 [Blastopirellula marina]|uniref:Uncharacterized protein n=1 Tax=Blastopirellula marina TaxID=124 RepID=A0A2S8G4I8_9BACT|nr:MULTISPECIES: hypothetical protein [Pirellulaceae]PQO39369.1 hypothetical protein C5Y96_05810 [Blastopirellula marina]RCS55677.1 hypothetical protein DTL36_05820 [Bremerella cremea]